jgi:archaellum component FlaC
MTVYQEISSINKSIYNIKDNLKTLYNSINLLKWALPFVATGYITLIGIIWNNTIQNIKERLHEIDHKIEMIEQHEKKNI